MSSKTLTERLCWRVCCDAKKKEKQVESVGSGSPSRTRGGGGRFQMGGCLAVTGSEGCEGLLGVRDGLWWGGHATQHLQPLPQSHRCLHSWQTQTPPHLCLHMNTLFFSCGFNTYWVAHHLGELWHQQWWGWSLHLNYPDPHPWKSQHSTPCAESSVWPLHCLCVS